MQQIIDRLNNINVPARILEIEEEIKPATNPRVIDKLVKELKILRSLNNDGVSPLDAFTQQMVPVIPAMYRSPAELSNGTIRLPDINLLLKDIGFANNTLKEAIKEGLPEDEIAHIKHNLYRSVEQLSGFDAPTDNKKVVHNAFTTIAGKNSPKGGYFQQNVIRKRQDLTGRSTLAPDPTLGIDEVRLPMEIGYKIYQPFIEKELRDMGYKREEIDSHIAKRTDVAFAALKQAGKDRPVLINRAPSIRNTSINALWPIFSAGKEIGVPNLLAGLNVSMDFDGDSASIHVPVTQKGIQDAYKLLPSRNLSWEPTGELLTGPNHAAATGLFLLSQTKEGRKQINDILPPNYSIKKETNKDELYKILSGMDKEGIKNTGDVMNKLRLLGDDYIYRSGHTIGLSDIAPMPEITTKVLNNLKRDIHYLGDEADIDKLYDDYGDELIKKLKEEYKIHPTSTGNMLLAKARGNPTQFRDIVLTPLGSKDNVISTPIEHGYAEGLDPWEYWSAASGARKGIISRSQETAMPGALANELLMTENQLVVGNIKNKHMNVIELSVDSPGDILDRIIGRDIVISDELTIKKDTAVTPAILKIAQKNRINKLPVYTVMGSSDTDGALPSMGYGLNKDNKLMDIGENIGVISSHAIVAPLYTGSLKAFHTGGSAGVNTSGYPRIKQILEMHKILPKQATLSKEEGIIASITPDSLNGHNIVINGNKYYTLPGNRVLISVGDKVSPGDPLSDGPIQPEEIARYKGLDKAQEYMVKELQSNVPDASRRSLEVVVEGLTRYGKIIRGGDTDFLPGDTALLSKIKAENSKVQSPATYEIMFKGINQLPQETQGWATQLGFRYLKKLMQRNIAEGAEEEKHSYSPTTGIMFGQDFGTGEKGKY